jgi:mono/diheme cytochrome c family protein
MGRNGFAFAGFALACLHCNSPPPIPENPVPANAPNLGATRIESSPLPPISGGTMLLSRDGKTLVVADPDRDFVSFVDVSASAPVVRAKSALSPQDEPGRIAEDAVGRIYVALRGSGDLATLSPATGDVLERRPVCAQPRGVAYDERADQILVGCATGELVTLPSAGGSSQTITLEPDLRDVIVDGDSIFVSKFRTAQVLQLDRTGSILRHVTLPTDSSGESPAMAWRMRLTGDHQLLVLYQKDSTAFVPTTPGGYSNSGGEPSNNSGSGPSNPGSGGPTFSTGRASGAGIVVTSTAAVSTTDLSATPWGARPADGVLPVDFAVPPIAADPEKYMVMVAAGSWKSRLAIPYTQLTNPPGLRNGAQAVDGQLIAVEIGNGGTIFLQSREPARLYVVKTGSPGATDEVVASLSLSDESREDTGHTIFHTNSGGAVACASCHGEGGEDAQTWNFDGKKPRRTASLLGTVKGTAPYHWDGDFRDMQALVHEVYTRRMGGRSLAPDQVAALQHWVEQLPAPRRPAVDTAASARGEILFQGKAGCASCHSGPSYTNNATVDVGTGAPLQVPPLVGVGARAPFLHAGCATTLKERFTNCATSAHGNTANLTNDEISDLVTFLSSL